MYLIIDLLLFKHFPTTPNTLRVWFDDNNNHRHTSKSAPKMLSHRNTTKEQKPDQNYLAKDMQLHIRTTTVKAAWFSGTKRPD